MRLQFILFTQTAQNYTSDLGTSLREVLFNKNKGKEDSKILLQAISEYLYRVGMIDVADTLCQVQL